MTIAPVGFFVKLDHHLIAACAISPFLPILWQWDTLAAFTSHQTQYLMESSEQPPVETPATPVEMNLGEQPILAVITERNLKAHDLVTASNGRITHKMVTRACKGRRLTRNTQALVCDALNAACHGTFVVGDLFNYTATFHNRNLVAQGLEP